MALFQVDYYSKSLAKSTCFHVLVPNDASPEMIKENVHYNRKMKSLYLLHGYSGNSKDWLLGSSVQEMSIKYNLAIIMPSGDNSFYLDGKGTGRAYCQYVGKELVEYTRRVFGLSEDKDDTYIGGLSMGGFGAIHTGLYFPETFGKIVGLSSALIIHNIEHIQEDHKDLIADYYYYNSVFGDLNQLDNSVNNPEFLIQRLQQEQKTIPQIYMACGTEDFLLEENRAFYQFLTKSGIKAEYLESPGVHNWEFWNRYLEPSIKWSLGIA
ncbi:MAG: xynC [Firmicutes bacterium]|nr:xynC [Bacillota bacterium]